VTGVLNLLLGSAGYLVQLANASVSDNNIGAAAAGYELQNDGDIIESTSIGGTIDLGDWITPKTAAPGSFECRATVVSGSLSSGTTGAWLALSTSRTWSVTRATSGTSSCQLTIEIRLGTTVLASATVMISATVT
jgi:hypothetical protein